MGWLGKTGVWFLFLFLFGGYSYAQCGDDIVGEAAKNILIQKCGVCHRGPFLDMTSYPFISSDFNPESILFREFIERIEKQGWGVMPPVNGTPLTDDEKRTVLDWLRSRP